MKPHHATKTGAVQGKLEATGSQHLPATAGIDQTIASPVVGDLSAWTYRRRDRLRENRERQVRRGYASIGLRLRKSPARRKEVVGFGLFGIWRSNGLSFDEDDCGCPFQLSLEDAGIILEHLRLRFAKKAKPVADFVPPVAVPVQAARHSTRVPFVQKLANFYARFMS